MPGVMRTGMVRRMHGGAVVGPDSPDDIAGLQVWLKADSGTGGASDGDQVTTWTDQSANSRSPTQGTAAQRPTYKTGILNGLPVVRFDGTDDFLRYSAGADWLTGTTATVAIVVKQLSASGAANGRFLSTNINGSNADHNTAASFLFYNGGSEDRMAVFRNSAEKTRQGPAIPAGFSITLFWFDGTDINQRHNGAAATVSSAGSTGTFAVRELTVGKSREDGVFEGTNCDIAEVVIYDNDIGSSNRSALETYLNAKWAVY